MARIAQIVSTARYLPEQVVTNAELTARFKALGKPTVIDRLAASTGITQRFHVPDDWVTSDLALPAAKEAALEPWVDTRTRVDKMRDKIRDQLAARARDLVDF